MKILYASNVKIDLELGDTVHFLSLARALQAKSRVTIIGRGNMVAEAFGDLVDVHTIPLFRVPKIGVLLNDALIAWSVIRYLNKGIYSVLYQRSVPYVNWYASKLNIPSIVEVNGVHIDEVKFTVNKKHIVKYYQLRERNTLVKATKIICVTNGIKNQLINRYGVYDEQCVVVPNATDTNYFYPRSKSDSQTQLNIDSKKYIIGFVGSFQHWVDFNALITAVEILKGLDVPVHCVLIGDGVQHNYVKQLIIEKNLEGLFSIPGRKPFREIPVWISAFDVCVAPFVRNRNEAIGLSPLKLFEYMACERPIIATDLPGITNVIQLSNSGLTYAIEDADDLANKLNELYNNSLLRQSFALEGYTYVKQNHSWARNAEIVGDIIDELGKK